MYRIGKRFRFEAAHSLGRLPDGHKCKRPHGHSYQVEFILESMSLDEYDFVTDYANLDPIKEVIERQIDHRDLNEIFRTHYGTEVETTAENLAKFFWQLANRLLGRTVLRTSARPALDLTVIVKETESTFAEYSEV